MDPLFDFPEKDNAEDDTISPENVSEDMRIRIFESPSLISYSEFALQLRNEMLVEKSIECASIEIANDLEMELFDEICERYVIIPLFQKILDQKNINESVQIVLVKDLLDLRRDFIYNLSQRVKNIRSKREEHKF